MPHARYETNGDIGEIVLSNPPFGRKSSITLVGADGREAGEDREIERPPETLWDFRVVCLNAPVLRRLVHDMRRDGRNVSQNDNFSVILDTFHDRRNGYEFLIKKFADDSGHTAQEFYTNRTVVHLMVQMRSSSILAKSSTMPSKDRGCIWYH